MKILEIRPVDVTSTEWGPGGTADVVVELRSGWFNKTTRREIWRAYSHDGIFWNYAHHRCLSQCDLNLKNIIAGHRDALERGETIYCQPQTVV